MKLIHTADLHLDSKLDSNLTPDAAYARRDELLRSFSETVRYAEEKGIGHILICGDLFDAGSVRSRTRMYVRDTVCSHPGIEFYYLRGNHDGSISGELSGNFHTFGDGWTYYDVGDVTIAGCETPDSLQRYGELTLSGDRVNIVMLHGQIYTGGGKLPEGNIMLKTLADKNIDYLALGHIHKQMGGRLDRRGIFSYCGCPEGRGFDECGEKGFNVIDTESGIGKVTYTFIPHALRTVYSVDVDITGLETRSAIEKKTLECCAGIPGDSLVKVILTGKYTMTTQKNLYDLTSVLGGRFYFAKVVDMSRLGISRELTVNDISLRGEFLRRAMASGLEGEELELVIQYGLDALSGDDMPDLR